LQGDYNGDNTVNAADYTVWRNSLGQAGPGRAADGDANGVVNILDFNIWKSHYGQSIPGPGSGSAVGVPEPTSAVLLVFGLAMLLFRSTRHR